MTSSQLKFSFRSLGSHTAGRAVLGLLLFAALQSGCSTDAQKKGKTYQFTGSTRPMITSVLSNESSVKLSQPAAAHPSEVAATSSEKKVETSVRFMKEEILLGREFLYGSDLQYSSIFDEDMSLHYQSLANGHEIAVFRVFGKELQLVAKTDHYFESDVNHPERLLHAFPILSEDETSVTVSITRGSATLTTFAEGGEAAPARSNWLRSLQYIERGNYLLMESSIETGAGNVVEFLESVFPRDTLVPTNYEPIYNDPSINPLAERFGFLSNSMVYLPDGNGGKFPTALASRFLPSADKTIDWYVTRNAPADLLPALRTGVEAWNRYFQDMWDRDGVRFVGYLPEDVKLGDPRYNVINWDMIAEAGAAYEQQAVDPLTGIQSHSMIYLPAAWLNIGYTYWQKGQFSETHAEHLTRFQNRLKKARFLGKGVEPKCMADLTQSLALKSDISPAEFAVELLKGVLFHEMGHALGLAHNFKASLSFGPQDTLNGNPVEELPFATSIMDYNQFQIERDAFESISSANGPLLEYDRQIISVLYNEGWDVKDSDPVLPACEDSVADYAQGAVDPLCIRYDAGQDPTVQLDQTRELIETLNARLGRTLSLPRSIQRYREELDLGTASQLGEAAATIQQKYMELFGTMNFYTNAGAQSMANMLSLTSKALHEHVDSDAPEFDRIEGGSFGLRARVFSNLRWVLSLNEMPEAVRSEMSALKTQVMEWLKTQTFYTQLPEANRGMIDAIFSQFLDGMHGSFTGAGEGSPISKMRSRVLSSLIRKPSASLYLGKSASGDSVDYESEVIALAQRALFAEVTPGTFRPLIERVLSARILKSYESTEAGVVALLQAREKVSQEIRSAKTTAERDGLRALRKVLL